MLVENKEKRKAEDSERNDLRINRRLWQLNMSIPFWWLRVFRKLISIPTRLIYGTRIANTSSSLKRFIASHKVTIKKCCFRHLNRKKYA